jgi:predicted pyridoxine 5'-phosphate oxidase superfamily flavin-nucleotide-binding protein
MTAASVVRDAVLTPAMRELVADVRLGYVATVCDDGTPHLSARGSLLPWEPDQLVFLEVRGRTTYANLLERPSVVITVVDPASRLGYRFSGEATVVTEGRLFDDVRDELLVVELHHCVRAVVSIAVHDAEPLVLSVYGERDVQRCYDARRLRPACRG